MAQREAYMKTQVELPPEKLVVLDECGTNTNMSRLYAWGKGGERATDGVPLNTGATTTVLSSMRLNGEKVFTTYSGALNGERFKEYLRESLLPTLRPGDIVVMDNLRAHKVSGVAQLFEAAGVMLLYLPPYSPDLNPIEQMWSKVKAYLRKVKARSVDALLDAIPAAFALVSPIDVAAWFAHAGYSC